VFVKNQSFSDEETLLEVLFDFELGAPTPYIQEIRSEINHELKDHEEYQALLATMTDEEDRMELEDEERRLRLADILLERFTSFRTLKQKLYGVKDDQETLLWEIDLV
jgi:rubrerythrin